MTALLAPGTTELLDHDHAWSIEILGETPRPQGSLRHVGGGRLVYSDTLLLWRQSVQHAAAEALPPDWTPFDDAVHLEAIFAFPQPKATPAWRRDFTVKEKGSDLDKLVRAIGDSLERAHVLTDDSRIAAISAARVFCPHVLPDTGVRITVTPFLLPTKG